MRVLRYLLRLVLRIFFRRVEVTGADRIPPEGPVILLPNHPNGLVDPVLILTATTRQVVPLAKAPLFHMPVVGWVVRALGAIPVYRRQDGASDPRGNRTMFAAAGLALARGRAIVIFPEGASHSDPDLRPLKTGAARIALGAEGVGRIALVPAGLYYTEKAIFRSDALCYFGTPFFVDPIPPGPDGEPEPAAVRALTQHIDQALRAVTLQATEHEALGLVARAERLLSVDASDPRLEGRFKLRQRLLDGYSKLRARSPERLAALEQRIRRHEERLDGAGLDPHDLRQRHFTFASVTTYTLRSLLFFTALIPFAVPGALLHFLPYRVVGMLANRIATESDVLATTKAMAGLLLFPLTWLLVGALAGQIWGWRLGLAAVVAQPLLGYAALVLQEKLDRFLGSTRAFMLYVAGRERFLRLLAERASIAREIQDLASLLDA